MKCRGSSVTEVINKMQQLSLRGWPKMEALACATALRSVSHMDAMEKFQNTSEIWLVVNYHYTWYDLHLSWFSTSDYLAGRR